jgi:hypothetical protein
MSKDPCLAWENICILTGGETTHHKSNINIAMKLENSNLTSNAKENMSIFGAHFEKVLNNHRSTTNSGIADSHMLDLLVCSTSLHKRVKNCCTTLDGLDSNHRAVVMELNSTSIKYKVKSS